MEQEFYLGEFECGPCDIRFDARYVGPDDFYVCVTASAGGADGDEIIIPMILRGEAGRQFAGMLLEYLDLATGRAMLGRSREYRPTDRRRIGRFANDASNVTLTVNPDAEYGFVLWLEFNWPGEYGDQLVTVELAPDQVRQALDLLYRGDRAIFEAQARAAAEALDDEPEEEPEPSGTVWMIPPPPHPLFSSLFTPRTIRVIPPRDWHGRTVIRTPGGGLFALDEQNRLIPITQEQWEEYLRKQRGVEP